MDQIDAQGKPKQARKPAQAQVRQQAQAQARQLAQAQARQLAQAQARQQAQAQEQARKRAQHIQQSKKMGDRLRRASFSHRDSPKIDPRLKKTLKAMQEITKGVPRYMNLPCRLCKTINNNTNTYCTKCGYELSNTVSKSQLKLRIKRQDDILRQKGELPFGEFKWNSWIKTNS
jgi:multidrug efflux pump subunit AcrA (membrane-fusion protein)